MPSKLEPLDHRLWALHSKTHKTQLAILLGLCCCLVLVPPSWLVLLPPAGAPLLLVLPPLACVPPSCLCPLPPACALPLPPPAYASLLLMPFLFLGSLPPSSGAFADEASQLSPL